MQKVLGLIGLLLAVSFASEVITFDNNWGQHSLFNIVSETRGSVELIFSMHELVIEEQVLDGVAMKTFGVPGVFLPDPGVPNLSGATRYLALPQGAKAQVTILDARTQVYYNVEVGPAPNIPLETDKSPLRYEKNMSIYGRNAYWPASPVKLSAPTQIRGVDVVSVGIIPFQYNPVTKELLVYKDIKFRVDFRGGNGRFGEDRLRSRFWEPILQGQLLNYKSLPRLDFYGPQRIGARAGFEYIIIVPDDPVFIAWADTIKNWRKLQGISCDVFTLTEVGGSTSAAIEAFLNNAYNTWDPAPVAFLLLSDYPTSGDVYGITSPVWNSYCVSDNIYADVNADDLPDMHHARITAQTEAQLGIMINKFLSYERSPYTAANFYDNPLVACGWQDDRWFQLAAEVCRGFLVTGLGKNPARQYNLGSPANPTIGGPWTTRAGSRSTIQYWYNIGWLPDTLNQQNSTWWNNGSAAGVNAAINSGAFFVQHRDHGNYDGWGEPDYTIPDLDGLSNTMFTFVNSTNCLTGAYDYAGEVFAEKFHRIQYGALGLNAATEISYSFVNDTYIWGMWDCMWQQFDPLYPGVDTFNNTGYDNLRPCMAMTYGKYYLKNMWFPDSIAGVAPYRVYTYHLFHHHGDAFITMYSQIPQNLTVNHAPTLIGGATSFTVTANDSSVIALTVNGEIIGVAEGTGAPVLITIQPQIPGNIMKVTVTKANYYRYTADVPVVSSTYPFVILSTILINDSGGNGQVNPGETVDLGVYAKNVGTGTANSVYGLLAESDPYVIISIDSSWYGNIAQNDSVLANPFYNFGVTNNCPNNHNIDFTLQFYDINDTIWTSYKTIKVYAPVLTYQGVSVVGGNGNGILDPGETANLVVKIKNTGGAVAENVTSTLMESSTYITMNDSLANFGTINPGDTANNVLDPYTVTASGTTPTGTVVQFQIQVVSGIYIDTLNFSLTVGKKHYYIWNPDPTPAPGLSCHTILGSLGYSGDYGTTLAPDLTLYQVMLVFVGIYPNNYVIGSGSSEATALVNFLQNQDGRMYLEGGDVWYYDPLIGGYNFCPLFGINATDDGTSDMGPVLGQTGTFTNGMNFNYGGENDWMDHISASGSGAFLIFRDSDNAYDCGVANVVASGYKTVGTSFELGGLVDGTPPSTRAALLDSIMHFFGIFVVGINEDEVLTVLTSSPGFAIAPNPFFGKINIRFMIQDTRYRIQNISLKIYDTAGKLVRDLTNNLASCILNHVSVIFWEGNDNIGRKLPAGVYFIRLETEGFKKVEKAILLK